MNNIILKYFIQINNNLIKQLNTYYFLLNLLNILSYIFWSWFRLVSGEKCLYITIFIENIEKIDKEKWKERIKNFEM